MFVELHYVNERGYMVDVQVPNDLIGSAIIVREHEQETAENRQQLFKADHHVQYDLKYQRTNAASKKAQDVVIEMGRVAPAATKME